MNSYMVVCAFNQIKTIEAEDMETAVILADDVLDIFSEDYDLAPGQGYIEEIKELKI